MATFHKILHSLFIRSWWVIAFMLFCGIIYEQGLKERNKLYQQLTEQYGALLQEKHKVLDQQQNLQLQINSQSDLAWVELALMKGLGLVPEGQQKVYFYPDDRCHKKHPKKAEDDLSIAL